MLRADADRGPACVRGTAPLYLDSIMASWVERHRIILLLAALLLTALAYLPGLRGAFIYDDFVFLVDNVAVQVSSLAPGDWIAAANAFPAAHQGRWLGMLTFAANHYASGMDAAAYKATNLAIHLGNGVLVWLMLRALAELAAATTAASESRLKQVALAVACLWLLLPVNLTAVLYVSQRLESLSNTFVLLGLLGYLRMRLRDWRGEAVDWRLVAVVVACTATGALVKESAILLPLYVACIEWVLTGLRRADGRRSRAMVATMTLCLALPLVVGLIWLATWVGGERSYAREFTLGERLMTQGRVLVGYIQWTLLPNLSDLTLYHDDISVSRSMTRPATTLPALIAIAGLLASVVWMRVRAPMWSLGILLFFAGHALTSTVIPLTLAFEHRNYFPSIGLLLAVGSAAAAILRRASPVFKVATAGLAISFLAATTHLRSLEWSDPIRLASSEAAKRPQSANAQYEYARSLIVAANYDPRHPLAERALGVLLTAKTLPAAGLLFHNAIINLKSRRGETIEAAEWEAMLTLVASRAPKSSDAGALQALYQCMRTGTCPARFDVLRELLETIIAHPSADAAFYSLYGIFVYQEFGDLEASLAAFDEALRRKPRTPEFLSNRARILIAAGRLDQARSTVVELKSLGVAGSLDRLVKPLEAELRTREAPAATGPVRGE